MFSRRKFLHWSGLALAAAALPYRRPPALPDWPEGPDILLGRVAWPWGVNVLTRPHPDGQLVRQMFPEEVVVIRREVVGRGMAPHNHVWFELDDGFVYSPQLQPVRNIRHTPLASLPAGGAWTEVDVPYIDARSAPDPAAPVIHRLYYSSVFKVGQLAAGADGQVWYDVTPETGVRLFAPGQCFRPIAPEEVTPLAPNVDPAEKQVRVDLNAQALSAYEGKVEVFRARISSGAVFFGTDGVTLTSGTPKGGHNIWSKRFSRHMQGGTRDSGYDLPGVGWVCYFASNGAALHSTYWHNDYGLPKSHGCLNCRPQDAKWLFRWTAPAVAYDPGDITVNWDNRGTLVDIRLE